jgi:hypothetical protein
LRLGARRSRDDRHVVGVPAARFLAGVTADSRDALDAALTATVLRALKALARDPLGTGRVLVGASAQSASRAPR